MLAGWEWMVGLVIVVILVGGKKLPELGSGLGKGISEFKKAIASGDEGQEKKIDQPAPEQKAGETKPGDTPQ